jgi:hypothetical protein
MDCKDKGDQQEVQQTKADDDASGQDLFIGP